MTRQDEARKIDPDYTKLDVPTDQKGLKAFLETLLNVPERGQEAGDAPMEAPPEPVREQSYTAKSVELDEVFDNLTLSQQLHFASIAMENARSRLK